jgi:tartronate-semialdehyde synthase
VTVSEAIVAIMEREGITTAFGIPGAGINGLYKYLEQSGAIRHYTMRHEEAAVHAAGGHFRASGKMAAALCTAGPGATNFVTGVYTCNIDSIPLVAITGQAVRAQLGLDAFQCVDIAEICEPIAKKTYRMYEPEKVPGLLAEAFYTARSGKPGPVVIDLPLDVQMAEIDFDPAGYAPRAVEVPAPEAGAVEEAVRVLAAAQNPVLVMGGGVVLSGACGACVRLAEQLNIPVITTYMAKGGIPEGHPLNAGHAGIQVGQPIGNQTLLASDVVLGIGCRFTDRHTGALPVYTEGRKFIHVNIDPREIGKIVTPEVGIAADAGKAIEALAAAARRAGLRFDSKRTAAVPAERAALARRTDYAETPIKPQRVFREMNDVMGDGGKVNFTTGCGLTQIWSGQLQKISHPRTYLPSGGAGTLGYDIPAAFGAMAANPGKKAVAVMGDFGFTFHVQELAVAAKYEKPLIVVIVNNAYLGLIRQNQKYAYGYEYGVEMRENQTIIDYVKVAQGLGCEAERVFSPDEIAPAMRRALAAGRPYVIDVICEEATDCSMGGAINAVREFV